MPIRRRNGEAGELHPAVVEFLTTGSTARAEAEISPWVVMSLNSPPADVARLAWMAGDLAGAVAALKRCVAAHNLFVGKGDPR